MKFFDKVKSWFSKKLAVTIVGGVVIIVVSTNTVATICATALAGAYIYCQHRVDIAKLKK